MLSYKPIERFMVRNIKFVVVFFFFFLVFFFCFFLFCFVCLICFVFRPIFICSNNKMHNVHVEQLRVATCNCMISITIHLRAFHPTFISLVYVQIEAHLY